MLRRLRRSTPLVLRGVAAEGPEGWELRRLWEDANSGKQAQHRRVEGLGGWVWKWV